MILTFTLTLAMVCIQFQTLLGIASISVESGRLCLNYKDIVDEKAPRLIGVVKEVKVVEENNAKCQTGVKYFPGRHGTTAANSGTMQPLEEPQSWALV